MSYRWWYGDDLYAASWLLFRSFATMFCVGIVLSSAWLAQTICYVAVLPCSLWYIYLLTWPEYADRRPGNAYWIIVGGIGIYLFILLTATALADYTGPDSMGEQIRNAGLCLVSVAGAAAAARNFPHYPSVLCRWMMISSLPAGLLLLAITAGKHKLGMERLGGDPDINWILNPNALAATYAVCFALALAHLFHDRITTAERAMTAFAAVLHLAIVLLTASRGALLACMVALAITLVRLSVRRALTIFCLCILAAVALIILFPERAQSLLARGDAYRFELWKHYLELILERPWLGYGLNFDTKFFIGQEPIYTPHNIILSAALRGGIPAALALIGVLATALVVSISAARRGFWLPLLLLATSVTLGSVDHPMLPDKFNYSWYLYWLPLAVVAGAVVPGRQRTA